MKSKKGLRLLLGALGLSSAITGAAFATNNNFSDAYCELGFHAQGQANWLVDNVNALTAQDLGYTNVDAAHLIRLMDQTFNNALRHTRSLGRQRVLNITNQACHYSGPATDLGCVEFGAEQGGPTTPPFFVSEDPVCLDRCNNLQSCRNRCLSASDCQYLIGEYCDQTIGVCTNVCHSNADCKTDNEFCGTDGQCDTKTPFTQGEGILGYGGTGVRPYLVLCQSIAGNSELQNGDFDLVATHEPTHAFGADHPDNESANCVTANNNVNTSCTGWTDGCAGEMMCSDANCARGPFPQTGDQRSIRNAWNDVGTNVDYVWQRSVFTGSMPNPSSPARPTMSALGRHVSGREPRIDCVRGTTADHAQCVAVETVMTDSSHALIQPVRMTGFNTTTGAFSGIFSLNTLGFFAAMPPDIAIDANGDNAFIAFAETTNNNRVLVFRVDLNTGTVNQNTVVVDGNGNELDAILPPRIVFSHQFNDPIVFVYRSTRDTLTFERNPPTMAAIRVHFPSTGSPTFTQQDFGVLTTTTPGQGFSVTPLASDFDVDCSDDFVGGLLPHHQDQCTFAGLLRRNSDGNRIDQNYSYVFSIWGSSIFTDSDFSLNPKILVQNSVDAVARPNTTSSSPVRVVVSSGSYITVNTNTQNTIVHSYSGNEAADGVSGSTFVASNLHQSDAEQCSSTSSGGFTIPAATLHGGYSLSFCGACGGGLVSINWGFGDASYSNSELCN
jgi:hypothetical protein